MEELVSKQDCLEALKHLETVYTVRLFSVFEGILKEHIVLSHPHIHLPEDAKAIWLIDRVANLQTPHISSSIREHAHNVRKYRNYLIHSANVAANVDFDDALFYLSKYVAKLPAPPA